MDSQEIKVYYSCITVEHMTTSKENAYCSKIILSKNFL